MTVLLVLLQAVVGELLAGPSAEEDGRSDADAAPAVRLPGMDDLSSSLAALAADGSADAEVAPQLEKRRTK